jgi:hypothetical protein
MLTMTDCPAFDCSGGRNRGFEQRQRPDYLPESVKSPREEATLYRCNYCGFLWFEYMLMELPQPFLMQRPVGFYDNISKPLEFFPVPPTYRLKSKPTPKKHRR